MAMCRHGRSTLFCLKCKWIASGEKTLIERVAKLEKELEELRGECQHLNQTCACYTESDEE